MTKEERELLFDILSKMEQLKPDQREQVLQFAESLANTKETDSMEQLEKEQQERVLQFMESLTSEEKKRFREMVTIWEQVKDSNLICR